MPRITPVHWKILECIFQYAGFTFSRQTGAHRIYVKPGTRPVVIPVHSAPIDPFIIQTNIRTSKITRQDYFNYLEKNSEALLSRDPSVLTHIAAENCRIKAAVVAEDPTEKNKRSILNYGHTLGHAVESASAFSLLHGEAVAIGMIAAGLLEKAMGLVTDDRLTRIRSLLEKLGQPTHIPANLSLDAITDLLKRDKKAVAQWPRFVLLETLGKTLCKNERWTQDVPVEALETVINILMPS